MSVAPTAAASLSRAPRAGERGLSPSVRPPRSALPTVGETGGKPAATAAGAASGKFRMATFNVWNMFDTADDPATRDMVLTGEQYQQKLQKLSLAIRDKLGAADVITLQEIENQRVLDDLVALPEMQRLGYRSVVMDGNDSRGINVAMLYRSGSIDIRNVGRANGASPPLPDTGRGQKDPSLLFARPPLVVDLTWHGGAAAAEGARNVTMIVNHFKSKLGGPKSDPRREEQAAFVGGLVDARRAADPFANVIVAGDLNLRPDERSYERLVRDDKGNDRLFDASGTLPDADRYTYNYKGNRQQLDHVLVTPELQRAMTAVSIPHFNTDWNPDRRWDPAIPDNVSDHDPIVATFDFRRMGAAQAAEGVSAIG